MSKQFKEGDISFRYPENWRLEREDGDEGWTVSLQSPGTAFAIIRIDDNMPDTEEVAQTALDALRSEYPSLEAEPRVETVAGQMAVGHDVNFFTLDMTNTCWTRSLYSEAGTLLVLCQSSDLDLELYEPALRAICASLKVEE